MKQFSLPMIASLILLFVSLFFAAVVPGASYSPQIHQAQKTLQRLGYFPGTLDGIGGSAAQGAVRRFPRDVGLSVKGRLDTDTRNYLVLNRGMKIGRSTRERRIALVIGNSAYENASLANSANDARDMADALRDLGFEVIEKINADERKMITAIDDFYQGLRRADVGLFYFAGHGMQIRGSNYLIPVGAHVTSETDVEFEAVEAGRVLGKMKSAGTKLNIVILDACRDNPFKRRFRADQKGLAQMDAPKGTIIAYATSPGAVAADGVGRNGIYTKHLLIHIKRPELNMQEVFMETGLGVMGETADTQIPWVSSTPIPRYYLASSGAIIDEPTLPPQGASLSVESNVRGATVFVDGRGVGATPLSDIPISVGRHTVLVVKPGYATYQKRLIVDFGRSVSLYVDMSAAVKTTGRLYLDTVPQDAGVRILNISSKFYQGIELDEGSYQLEVSADGWVTKVFWVMLGAGGAKKVVVQLERVSAGVSQDRFTNSQGMEFVAIPAGSFRMGSMMSPEEVAEKYEGKAKWYKHEHPRHKVKLTRGFYLQTTEVTQGQWLAVMGSNPSYFKSCGQDCPVEQVSWNDAQAFIHQLNRKEGTDTYRLPTEAEWEYAARAGSSRAYCFGDDKGRLSEYAWFEDNSSSRTHPVARKRANAWGFYDMHGNVWEWCQDWYGDYPSKSVSNPQGPSKGSYRVHRGGSWVKRARFCRSANRFKSYPDRRNRYLGFRLARTQD